MDPLHGRAKQSVSFYVFPFSEIQVDFLMTCSEWITSNKCVTLKLKGTKTLNSSYFYCKI